MLQNKLCFLHHVTKWVVSGTIPLTKWHCVCCIQIQNDIVSAAILLIKWQCLKHVAASKSGTTNALQGESVIHIRICAGGQKSGVPFMHVSFGDATFACLCCNSFYKMTVSAASCYKMNCVRCNSSNKITLHLLQIANAFTKWHCVCCIQLQNDIVSTASCYKMTLCWLYFILCHNIMLIEFPKLPYNILIHQPHFYYNMSLCLSYFQLPHNYCQFHLNYNTTLCWLYFPLWSWPCVLQFLEQHDIVLVSFSITMWHCQQYFLLQN